ncbi:sugar kinase [Microbacterium terricola]|uniref:2-dehydro-3-deoxygluconokinase n=1 Tax=Microbacterium terricola TaxID=344163 RepID=A0ABM8DW90_9MICO|nr:sugar kinase [Microbacterium terricola]UYK39382.1 sugar kinase [Microbacterium terricola]BDV29894.1 2-dehydro-3-deoxygluconokinase [Microbacterium terricola]
MDLLTLGEALICFDSGDDTLDATGVVRKYVVGAESNVAIGLARLGHSSAYVGRVGRDSLGTEIARTLRGEGVDVTHITRHAGAATGILLKERLRNGRTEITYHRAGSAGSGLSVDDLPADFAGVRRLHVTGITLHLSAAARAAVLEAMRRAQAAGCRVSLDANFRRKLATRDELAGAFAEAAALADDVLLGRAEAALCAGSDDDAAVEAFARGLGVETVVVKGRQGGARAYAGGTVVESTALPTTVVDPVGAGDGFAVGYLHALLHGGSLRDALEMGGRVSAKVIGRRGDYHGLPFPEDLDAHTTAGVTR